MTPDDAGREARGSERPSGRPRETLPKMPAPIGWIDDRLGMSRMLRRSLDKVFPDHWSFMLGEIALYSFILLVATGTFMTFFFEPSSEETIYRGSYLPLHGAVVSNAYRSVLDLSFDVRAGLVMRQTHHWAAIVFIGAIVLHLCRIFFTGAFRKPREIKWLIGVTLLLLALLNGFSGYSLPDDLLSGTGLRIMYSVTLSVPLIGTWAAFLLFGGEFPAHRIIERLFVLHVFIVPVLLGGLLAAHLAIVWHQKHTQFPGPDRSERTVVGSRFWPTYTAKALGLFFLVAAVGAGLGGLVQINPVWLYGPFQPSQATSPAQPDWYLGWIEGALRLYPPWEFRTGFNIPTVFFPAVLLPGVTFMLLYAWPFLEARMTHDHAVHHLLDRPRDRPMRTALGALTLTFYGVLFFAASNDLVAKWLQVSVETVTDVFRVLLFVLPPIVGAAAYVLCVGLVRSGAPRLSRMPARALWSRSRASGPSSRP
jgi:ubiquinol-cytochrome c reductase cytochrome b subunit